MSKKVVRKEEENYRINEEITAAEVRLVTENNEQPVVVTIQRALELAAEAGLDLIEIANNANPPVCKLGDYYKFLFEKRKKARELKAKSTKSVLKEIPMGPHIGEHDFNFKVNHAKKFLEDGAKVKAFVQFRGREIVFKQQGRDILDRFIKATEEIGKVEQAPTLEGKKMSIVIVPKKK